MNDLIKYSLLVALAVFGIGSYIVLNQPDAAFVVAEKIAPANLERGRFVIVCFGDKSGLEYRYELPRDDFELVQVNQRLRPSTVARWERQELREPERQPNALERLFMR